MRSYHLTAGATAAVGIVALLFAIPSAIAGHAFRALSPAEADARKVGSGSLCDQRCSFTTNVCPSSASPNDACATTWRTTRRLCLDANGVLGGCVACSGSGVNYRICASFPAVSCTNWGAANSNCGLMKKADCNWTGTNCVCPGLPANFSADACNRRDCTSP
jgi:hypothetical protein